MKKYSTLLVLLLITFISFSDEVLISQSGNIVKWYTLEIAEPGNYSILLYGDSDTRLTILGA